MAVEYPLGHRRRRKDGVPLLEAKFRTNLARRFPKERREAILAGYAWTRAAWKQRRSTSSSIYS